MWLQAAKARYRCRNLTMWQITITPNVTSTDR